MLNTTSLKNKFTVNLLFFLISIILFGFCMEVQAKTESDPILVFGHLNPDTDSVVGAISAANLLNKIGKTAEPMMQGSLTPESGFVLKKFNLKEPKILSTVSGKKIGIVDFTDLAQGPSDMKDAKLVFIVDHHKLGDVTSSTPLEAWIRPVGSTNTILFEMYQYYNVPISKDLAGAMLSAILSDTVIYKSVTTTAHDKAAGVALAKIAGITDPKKLGIEMFKVKSAIEGTPAKELVVRDYKDFNMSGKKIGVGQLELVDLSLINAHKQDLLAAMQTMKKDNKNHSIFLMLTDIMKEGTVLLVVTDDPSIVKKAFNQDLNNSEIWLPGVMSRKKQIIPNLEAAAK